MNKQAISWLDVIDYQMRIGSARVRMGGIGSVNTKPEYRMKGYAKRLLKDSIDYMVKEGYDVSGLFGIPDLYHKFGYSLCMPDYKLSMTTKNAEESKKKGKAEQYKIKKFKKTDLKSIIDLYNEQSQNRTCSLVRYRKYFTRFIRGTNWEADTDNLMIRNSKGLLAYAILDKSDHHVNVVEVMSKSDRDFPALLYEFAKMAIERRCSQINLYMPSDHPFAQYIQRYGCHLTVEYPKSGGGMLRIINQNSLFEKIQPELEKRMQKANMQGVSLRIETDLGETRLCLGRPSRKGLKHFLVLPQQSLIQLVVGHRNIRDILNDNGVRASKDIEPIADILFPGALPYMWLADHF